MSNTIENSAGAGLSYNPLTQKLDVDYSNLNAVDVSLNRDVSPTLGGDLNLNGKNIVGMGNINIDGSCSNGVISINNSSITRTPVSEDSLLNPIIDIGSSSDPVSLRLFSNADNKDFITLIGTCASTSGAGIVFRTSRGGIINPQSVAPGDSLGVFRVNAHNGSNYCLAGEFGMMADPDIPPSNGFVPGTFGAVVIDSAGKVNMMTFKSTGVLNAPIIKATSYATESLPAQPEEGWMVFDSTTKEFKGWNGTSWVVLG